VAHHPDDGPVRTTSADLIPRRGHSSSSPLVHAPAYPWLDSCWTIVQKAWDYIPFKRFSSSSMLMVGPDQVADQTATVRPDEVATPYRIPNLT